MVHVFQKSSAMVRDYFKIRKISRDRKLPKFFSIPDFFSQPSDVGCSVLDTKIDYTDQGL